MNRKAVVASFLLAMTIAFGFTTRIPKGDAQISGMILADVIHQGISSVNWTRDDPWVNRVCLTHLGQVFGELAPDAYETDIQNRISAKDWVQALRGIRMAEIDGYTSPAIDDYTRQVLDGHLMAGYLPANYFGDYLVYYRDELNGYKYAQELNHGDGKWDLENAYAQFTAAYSQASNFVWTCDSSGLVRDDDRWYDGGAQNLGVFLKFYENGISSAITCADQVWNKINTYPWSGYYSYHLQTGRGVECEICFETIVGEYVQQKNESIPYKDRLIEDINYKLLANGWNSALWSPGGYTICHLSKNQERREPATLSAFQVLHSYYPLFNETMKQTFISLLTDQTPAWLGLTQTDLCNPTLNYRFRMDSRNDWNDAALTDTGTAVGDMILFLEGIVPDTGSLAIPTLDEVYEDVCSSFPAQQFMFDYDGRTIRIPVNKGDMKFQFGSVLVPCTFPSNGVYDITFSSDWNSIVSMSGCGSISVSGIKDKTPVEFEAWVDDGNHVNLGTAGYTFSRLTPAEHEICARYNTTLLIQTLTVQASQTVSTLFDFDLTGDFTYSPVPAIENATTTFDVYGSRMRGGDTATYTWDFGDGIVISTQSLTTVHAYPAHGIYNVTLTVTDASGPTNVTSSWIEVLRHDLAIANLIPYRAWAYKGYSINMTVSVANMGNFTETAIIYVYCSETMGLITQKAFVLNAGENEQLTLAGSIDELQTYLNYTLEAVVAISFDSNLTNNSGLGSVCFQARIPGDLNGDRTVDLYDAIVLSIAFNTTPLNPHWNSNADINGDGAVDIQDALILAANNS